MKIKNLLFTAITITGFALTTLAQVPSYVPTNGLLGWWPFNGNSNDESGNSNNGTVNGATLTTDRQGNANSAYSFNGISSAGVSGNNITITNNFFDTGLNAFTISTWSKSNIFNNIDYSSTPQDIIHTNNDAGLGIACNWGNSGKYSIWAMSNPPANWDILYNSSSISNFVVNQWRHVVMVKNNLDYSIYIDGVLDTTFSTSIPAQSYLTGLKFGTYWTGEEAFNGKLDDFGVWNRALTQSEITNLFNGISFTQMLPTYRVPSYVPINGLLGWWPFNGNADDESGISNNGTVNGATLTADRFGNSNSAYSFNGISSTGVSGNNINVQNRVFDTGLNAFTISTWSNSNILDNIANSSTPQDIVHANNDAAFGIACNWGNSGKYSIWARSNSATGWDILNNKSSISNFVINQWKHVVMVKNNLAYSIYIDGVLDNTFTTTIVSPSYLTGLKFGTYWTGEEAFNGKLDDFGVWNRALTQSEITNLFKGNICFQYTTTFDTTQNAFTLTLDTATTSIANSYNWDFGDGNTSILQNPTHTFTQDTVYNVCLTINMGASDSCKYCHMIGKDYLGNIYRANGFTLKVINQTLQTDISRIISNENSFTIFPNPTNGDFNLKINQFKNVQIKIYNVFGECIYQNICLSHNLQIDLSSQAKGIYFVQLKTEQGTINKKLIIQ